MKIYERPIVLANEELAEGVYAASGAAAGGDCYTVTANIHQTPEGGREDYRIQVNAQHNATHHSTAQELTISFNQPVNYSFCNGNGASLKSGDGTATLVISLSYHNNDTDNIGFGDLAVTSGPGLAITSVAMSSCNRTCAQHDGLN